MAKELAEHNVPVILSHGRAAPDSFREKDAVVGPPLSRNIASYLSEAGVTYAISVGQWAMRTDYRIHDLLPEAAWQGKYAGITEEEIVGLVTTRVEEILHLKPSRDLVIYEGNPLEFGATVVLAFQADDETDRLELAACFPEEDEFVDVL